MKILRPTQKFLAVSAVGPQCYLSISLSVVGSLTLKCLTFTLTCE